MENDILKQIEHNNGKFPEAILKEIIKNKEEYIPKLLDALDYAYENNESLQQDYSYFTHIYASFLLAQFREARAHSKIAKIVSLPGEAPYNIYGDTITENLSRLLASTYDGDDSFIKGLIENKKIDEYVRSSAIATLTILVIYNFKTRSEIIDYFKSLFDGKLERKRSAAWSSLVNECCDLKAVELYDDIKKSFNEGLVDPMCVNMDDVDESMQSYFDETDITYLKDNIHNTLVTDMIADLRWWAAFNKNVSNRNYESLDINKCLQGDKKVKIGRNDPCPCGSGKKYKKCCGK